MSRKSSRRPSKRYLLDKFSLRDITTWSNRSTEVLRYYWEHYSELAHQRAEVIEDIKSVLRSYSQSINVTDWHRVVNYKYCNHPLSAKGSIIAIEGGRFNFGAIDPVKLPVFPALYVAEDAETALKEKFQPPMDRSGKFTADEFALVNKKSLCQVCLRGRLENVFDLNRPENLSDFLAKIKNFQISRVLQDRGARLGIKQNIIQTVKELEISLFDENWRFSPVNLNIPSNSQIFGQLLKEAGCDGILYRSKYTGKNNMAIFPGNFRNSASYLELNLPYPPEVKNPRLDAKTFEAFI